MSHSPQRQAAFPLIQQHPKVEEKSPSPAAKKAILEKRVHLEPCHRLVTGQMVEDAGKQDEMSTKVFDV